MSKEYLVRWEIDITANSPEEAARYAFTVQRDNTCRAVVFDLFRELGQ